MENGIFSYKDLKYFLLYNHLIGNKISVSNIDRMKVKEVSKKFTNEQWERIEALLPKIKTKRGRPAQEHRKLLNGIVWVLRTGAPWRDPSAELENWHTIYTRHNRWS